jgi:Flp pilus assembly protein TadD
MKANKKYLIISLVLVLIGCSSSAPRNSDETSVEEEADYQTSEMTQPVKPPQEEDFPKPAPVPTRDESNLLADAVKSQNDEAIARAARQVLAKNPNDSKSLNALGFYHYKKGQYPAALLFLGKAQKVNPNDSDVQNNIGLVHLAQKENREAVQAFRKALELNSSDANASANLGAIYADNKEYTKAATAMEMGYRKNSKDPKFLNNYAIALTGIGKYDDARDMYKKALSLSSNNKDLMLNYAILLIEHLKKYDEGLDILNKLKFLGPSTEARNRINVLEKTAKTGVK